MKLIFLIRSLNRGGAEGQLVTLVKALDKENFNVTVLEFYSGGILEQELNISGVKVISLKKKGRWDLLFFLWKLISCIKNIKPDVIHGYMGTANILTILIKPLFPNIRMIWGIRASNVDLNKYDWLSFLTYKVECLLSSFADLIIFNSHAGKKYHIAQGFSEKKIVVVPNGIDTQKFNFDIIEREKVRAEFCLCQKTILIGLVARLDPMKDHQTFLKAARLLLNDRQDVKFICVGNGEKSYAESLYKLTGDLGICDYVIWTRARDDLPAMYNAIDILTSSSSSGEGFSNVLGEAMACERLCVATDVGDSAWIIGNTGLVVSPQSPEALACAWNDAIKKNLTRRCPEARERIVDTFSIQKLLSNTVHALNSVVDVD